MGKTSRRIFGAGLAAAIALRTTEAFRPANERIFDARFDYALLPTFWVFYYCRASGMYWLP